MVEVQNPTCVRCGPKLQHNLWPPVIGVGRAINVLSFRVGEFAHELISPAAHGPDVLL